MGAELRVFLSHAEADRDSAQRLLSSLVDRGINANLAADTLLPGEDVRALVLNELAQADVVLVLLSERSARSAWQQAEIAYALGRKGIDAKVVPVFLDDPSRLRIPPLLQLRSGFDLSRNFREGTRRLSERLQILSSDGSQPLGAEIDWPELNASDAQPMGRDSPRRWASPRLSFFVSLAAALLSLLSTLGVVIYKVPIDGMAGRISPQLLLLLSVTLAVGMLGFYLGRYR